MSDMDDGKDDGLPIQSGCGSSEHSGLAISCVGELLWLHCAINHFTISIGKVPTSSLYNAGPTEPWTVMNTLKFFFLD